jgi:hypothetical protein
MVINTHIFNPVVTIQIYTNIYKIMTLRAIYTNQIIDNLIVCFSILNKILLEGKRVGNYHFQ